VVAGTSRSMHGGERKNLLLKNNVMRNIDAAFSNIQAFKPFMHVAISKEYTTSGSNLEFVEVV
jgi:hypothetical protein